MICVSVHNCVIRERECVMIHATFVSKFEFLKNCNLTMENPLKRRRLNDDDTDDLYAKTNSHSEHILITETELQRIIKRAMIRGLELYTKKKVKAIARDLKCSESMVYDWRGCDMEKHVTKALDAHREDVLLSKQSGIVMKLWKQKMRILISHEGNSH